VGKIELPEAQLFGSPSWSAWRVRLRCHISGGRVGFYERGTRRLLEVSRCEVAAPGLLEAARWLAARVSGFGDAELSVERASADGEIAMVLYAPGWRPAKGLRGRLEAELPSEHRVRGVRIEASVQAIEAGDPSVELGLAAAWVPESIASQRVPAGLFRQANEAVNRELVEYVASRVGGSGDRLSDVLELYGGCGNLTWSLSRVSRSLRMLEGEGFAVKHAKRLAQAAGLGHVKIESCSLDDRALTSWSARVAPWSPEVLVLDPPRVGAKGVCEALARGVCGERLRRIIYVSCDPACLGRDLGILSAAGWRVVECASFDMFPRGPHVESVAVLERVVS
jgi:23S rRNA (uracil1939-C5)-methyltransferase